MTNTYAPVLRQAFFQTKHWLVGQAWSTFQDTVALPEAADFIGPTDGTVFVRQAQVRYTYGGFSIAAENPQTTITPYRGGPQISTDDNAFPDFIGRYVWKGDWGSVTAAGLVRQLKYQTTGANAIDDSIWTAAGSLSGKIMAFGKDDVRWMIVGGNLGRYVALNFTNDAVLDSNGNLESIDGWAGYIAYRHLWTDRLRSSLFYSAEELRQRHRPDRPQCKPGERELDRESLLLADPEARHRRRIPLGQTRDRERRRRYAVPVPVDLEVLVLTGGRTARGAARAGLSSRPGASSHA